MEIYQKHLSKISNYIESKKNFTLNDYEPIFKNIFKDIKKFKDINANIKILEIGSGTGWFQILCKKNRISCKGIEISPQLVEYSHAFARKYNIEPDIEMGNIEEIEIGDNKYDIIIACSVFEHIEDWQNSIKKVYKALKEGGLLYFVSTNKFSFKSGEYSFPLYGWLPNFLRYNLRIFTQGEDIMKLGIDFNQFNYFQLRYFFNRVGFSAVYDFFEFVDPKDIDKSLKRNISKIIKRFKILKPIALLFWHTTFFICIK